MKKNILKISLIIVIALLFCIMLVNNVYASNATISVSNAVKGSSYTVTVNIPSNAVGYSGIITVKYSDGSVDSSGMLTKLTGMDGGAYSHPGNMSATFTAKASGTAAVTLEKVDIPDANGASISAETTKFFTVSDSAPAPAPTPTPDPSTTTPSTNTNTTTNTTANNNTTGVKFTDVNETIYTTEKCNIREKTSTNSNKVGTVEKGTELKRTGVGDNGWSRIEYNGKTCYISSAYITKEKVEIEFKKPSNETMYAKQSCNLRASWSTSSDKVGYLDAGQEVTVVGVADNGWSKIKYNGKEVYIATRLLQSEAVEEEPEEKEPEEPETTTPDTSEELKEIKEVVGVLPEVGNNISVYVYLVFAIVATILSIYGIYYINKK